MLYSFQKILADYRAYNKIDPSTALLDSFDDVETLRIRDFLKVNLEGIVNTLELNAPWETAEGVKPIPDRVVAAGHHTGSILLPDDFLRFGSVQLASWKKPVTSLSSEKEWSSFTSAFQGVRGNLWRPRAIIRRHAEGLMLHLQPFEEDSDDDFLASGVYLPRRVLLPDLSIHLSSALYPLLISSIPPPC